MLLLHILKGNLLDKKNQLWYPRNHTIELGLIHEHTNTYKLK